jgi:hypothetical protein
LGNGDCSEFADDMVDGNGGNADGATDGLIGISGVPFGFVARFDGTEMFKIPGVVRFSVALDS